MVAQAVATPGRTVKRCKKCGVRKSVSEFGPGIQCYRGRDIFCAPCRDQAKAPCKRDDSPCPKCGEPIGRTKRGDRRCFRCYGERRRASAMAVVRAYRERAKRTRPTRQGEQPASYSLVRANLIGESTWRWLEIQNAKQAWDSWLQERAPSEWLEAVRLFREQRKRDKWQRARHRRRLRKHGAPHQSLNLRDFRRLHDTAERCAYCRCKLTRKQLGKSRTSDSAIEHIIPLSRGGPHSIDNIVVVCHSCNSRKRAALAPEWFERDPCPEAKRALAFHVRRFGDQRQALLF